jgi:hypothetical protein
MVMKMKRLMMEEMMLCLPMMRVEARMMPSTSSPSRSRPHVRFLWFLVDLNVGSQIRFSVVKLFDEADSVPHGTDTWYGRALPIPVVIKPYGVASRDALSSQVRGKSFKLYHFKNIKFISNMIAPNDTFINTFIICNPMETSIKGAR